MNDEKLLEIVVSAADEVVASLSESEGLGLDEGWLQNKHISDVDNLETVSARLAVFNYTLKSTLYGIYQEESSSLSPITPQDDFINCLDIAEEATGNVAFEVQPLDRVVDNFPDQTRANLLSARKILYDLDAPSDYIGSVFENIVPHEARHQLGQFRTPSFIAEAMASWAVREGDDIVVDPGVGAGVLAENAYREKQNAMEKTNISEIWGIDLSELAIVMSSTALKIVNGDRNPNMLQANFMDVTAEGSTARLSQKHTATAAKADAVVSNPPYSRSHVITEKERLNSIAESDAGESISLRAPLYHYFYVHAATFLGQGGRLAFITPTHFLHTNYGEELRQFFIDRFNIHGILILDTDITVFEDADTSPCLVFLEKESETPSSHQTTFMRLSDWPGVETVLESLNGDATGELEFGFANKIQQSELVADYNWSEYVNEDSVDSIPGLKQFSEIATIKRGIATGMNDYFCLTQSEVKEWELDEDYLAPLIRRAKEVTGLRVADSDWTDWRDNGDAVWLFYCYDEHSETLPEDASPKLQAYLEEGRQVGADQSYLAKERSPWYAVDERDIPDIFVTYMSRHGFRFIENEAELRSLNNLHNIYLEDYSPEERRALLAYLNSDISNQLAKQSGRTYSRGLHKIEPGELKNVPVIDPRDLPHEQVEALAEAFDNLSKMETGGDDFEAATERLNQAVSAALSESYQQVNSIS